MKYLISIIIVSLLCLQALYFQGRRGRLEHEVVEIGREGKDKAMNKFSYSLAMTGVVEIVEISKGFDKPLRLNLKNVKIVIENVKRNHDLFATEEAYQLELSKYEGALVFLQGLTAARPDNLKLGTQKEWDMEQEEKCSTVFERTSGEWRV